MNNTQKLSVLFVTNNYTPYSGGVVNSLSLHATQLRNFGHTVTIVTLDFLNNNAGNEEHVIRLYCPFRWTMHTNHMAIPWQATKQLEKIIHALKPTIIHVHHPFLLGTSAYKAARNYTIPIVFTYHTLYEHYLHYIPFIPQIVTQPMLAHMVEKFCKKIDGIIAPSSIIHDQLNYANIKTPTALIPSGIRKEFFTPAPLLPKKNNNELHLLTVSRFAKEKNIPFLIDVIAKLDQKKFKAHFIGYGPEKKNLEQYAFEDKKIPPSMLQFIEKPSKEMLINAYYSADVFIFASKSETQGLVLAEAMSQGTPVVAVHGPGQRDLIEQGKNGFLVHSQREMQNTLEHLQQNPNLINVLQLNAFETAQQFTPEKVTSCLVKFYRDIINQYALSNKHSFEVIY